MKKLLWSISALLVAALLLPLTAAAAAEPEGDDVYAVATTESGRQITLSDAPDADEMGDLESYELIVDNEPVLAVEQSDVPDITSGADNNGYFSAAFDLPETTKHVFLAGLSAGKVEEIQNRVIAAYANGADFKLEDLSFIDAEKMYPDDDGDDYLCWAATTANMLTYTGWAAQAGFATTDDVFEDFIASFTDQGGSAYYGIGWFFNGVNTFDFLLPGQVTDATEGTGAYLTDYAYDMLVEYSNISAAGVKGMSAIYRALEDGKGVGLTLDVYHLGTYTGGHADTCWGYIADTTYRADQPEYYAGLFITDSDSDQPKSGDRRSAKNILQAVSITNGTDANGVLTYEFDLDSKNHAVLLEFTTLTPYSADVEKETDPAATRNKITTPDLFVEDFYLDTDMTSGTDYEISVDKIESNTTFFYTPLITNSADVAYNKSTKIYIQITDTTGSVVFSRTLNSTLSIDEGRSVSYVKSLVKNGGLPVGDYTVTATLNGNHTVSEAYYYNNTRSYPLKVRDSYLLGDADGSGDVTVMDATKIQRMVAGYGMVDDQAKQRSAITNNEINIMDATQIQRYLAEYMVKYPIGEKQLYD